MTETKTFNFDIDDVINFIGKSFKLYLESTNKNPPTVEYRHFFNQDSIEKISQTPIMTYKLKLTEPATVKGKYFSQEKDYVQRDTCEKIQSDGKNFFSKRLFHENIVSFNFYSSDFYIIQSLAQLFRNFMVLSRDEIRRTIQIPDILFWKRNEDGVLFVKGTLLYTCEIEIYIKTITIVLEEVDLIRKVLENVIYEKV